MILSLGLGLTLMLIIALIDTSVRGQLDGQMTASAPSFVLMNVDKATMPASNLKLHIAEILKKEGFISDVRREEFDESRKSLFM